MIFNFFFSKQFRYKLRLECMLLKAEYEANFSYLNPSLDTLINAAKGILSF